MPDPREDETLFDDLAIEDPRERRKAVRRERRRRFGGGEGGQPEKLAEGQNVWVERMKRNGKLIPYGQGIVDDWQQYELDEVSNEVHGDLSDFAGRVHDPERDEAFWNMYRKAIAELGSEIDRRASADRAVPARKVKRMLGTPFVRWTNVVATRTDGSASPMAKKVAAEFSVPDAAAHFGLTPEQELRMVELAGTRYNPRKRSIRIVSRRFRYREQNQRDIARIMVRLIAEARRAKPTVDTESIAASGGGEGEGGGIDEALLSAEAREERAAQLEEWYAHVRASVHAQEEAEAEGEAEALTAAEVEAEVGVELEAKAEALTAAEVEAEVGAELEAETASAEVPGAPVEADVAAEAAEAVTGEGDGLAALSRKELQALAKEHGLKANARSEELIKQLRAAGAKVPQ